MHGLKVISGQVDPQNMLLNLKLPVVEPGEHDEHGELPVVEPGEGSLTIAHHLRLQAARVGGKILFKCPIFLYVYAGEGNIM